MDGHTQPCYEPQSLLTGGYQINRVCSKIEPMAADAQMEGNLNRKLPNLCQATVWTLNRNELRLPVQRPILFSSLSNLPFSTFFASFDESHQAH